MTTETHSSRSSTGQLLGPPAAYHSVAEAVGAAPVGAAPQARARRRNRQNTALLVVATLLGLWLGVVAPEISPVAPVLSVAPVVLPMLTANDPAGTVGGPGSFGLRGGRR